MEWTERSKFDEKHETMSDSFLPSFLQPSGSRARGEFNVLRKVRRERWWCGVNTRVSNFLPCQSKNAVTFTFLLFLVRQKIVVPCFYAFFLQSLLDGERASTSTTLRLRLVAARDDSCRLPEWIGRAA